MPWYFPMCPCVDARARPHMYGNGSRVAHAESRAAIDPSAPPSFLPLVLTSHANVATEQPPSRRIIVRWGCRFDSRVTTSPSRASSRLADRRVPSSVRQQAEQVAATPCHVAANTAGRFSYCVSLRKGRAVPSRSLRVRRHSSWLLFHLNGAILAGRLRGFKIPVRRIDEIERPSEMPK